MPMAIASAGRPPHPAGPDPLTLSAVLSGLIVAVVLMQRSGLKSWRRPHDPLNFAPLAQLHQAAAKSIPASTTHGSPTVSDTWIDTAPISPTANIAPVTAAMPRTGQLQTWNELSAQVSHELRTPLNAVIGFTDVMHKELHGPVGDGRYREYLSHIRASSEALLKATEDTLVVTALLADPTPQERVALPLRDAIREASNRNDLADADTRTTLPGWSLQIDSDIAVEVDPRAFRQALVNLTAAACRHAGPDGSVTLRATATHGAVSIELQALATSGLSTTRHDTTINPQFTACDVRYPLSVARALLELQGSDLCETRHGALLCLSFSLTEATQHDMALFA